MLSIWPTGSWQGASGNLMCLDPQSKEAAEVSTGRLGASLGVYQKALGDRGVVKLPEQSGCLC